MSEQLPPAVAITIATVTTPKPPSAGDGTYRFLAGVTLFEVEELARGDFRYRLAVRTILADTSEAVLVDWITHNLQAGGRVIGWHLADVIVPALLEAADAASPKAAGDLVDVLTRAITMEAEDLADSHGGMAAPPFAQVCEAAGIATRTMTEEATFSDWSIGRTPEIGSMLATNVVAAWRLWAQQQRSGDVAPHHFGADALAQWPVEGDESLRWAKGEFSHG